MKPDIDQSLLGTYKMLKCAYPGGILKEDYYAILHLLYEHMSDRALSQVIEYLTGVSKYIIYNDVLASQSTSKPSQEDINRVILKLTACGYSEWTEES